MNEEHAQSVSLKRVIVTGDYTDASGRRWTIERIDKHWAWITQYGCVAIPVRITYLEQLPMFRRVATGDKQ